MKVKHNIIIIIITNFLLLSGTGMFIAGQLWILFKPDDPWLWFSRLALGVICLGFYCVIKTIEQLKGSG